MVQGEQVTVMGRTEDGQWLLVDTGKVATTKKQLIGWMKANQLSFDPDKILSLPQATPMPTATPLPGKEGKGKPGTNSREYRYKDEYGFEYAYNLPCGSSLPEGALCTCDCVEVPWPTATNTSCPHCGSHCACNIIHYWYPN
jgi:hypothetical protein